MIKKMVLMLCFVLVISGLAYATEYGEHPNNLEKPAGLSIRLGNNGEFLIRLTQPNSVMKLINEDEFSIFYELDWKINDGPWRFNKNWDEKGGNDISNYYAEGFDSFVIGILNGIIHDERNSIDRWILPEWWTGQDSYDLANNTYTYRFRYVCEYEDGDGFSHVVSPWSDTASIGKSSASQIPNNLEAPKNLVGEIKKYTDGQPYFHFTCDIPKTVEEANKLTEVKNVIDWKIGNGKWATESNELPFTKADITLFDNVNIDPIDEGNWDEVNIKENIYYFRAFFELEKPGGSKVVSPFSNIVEIGTPAFYSGASDWAKPELDRAAGYGLIPDILKNADMTKPITREEFAELSVLLYEKVSGDMIIPISPNPFTDTLNPQILRAFKIGITTGTSATTFSPNVLINREQCATILYRAIKAITPNADYNIAGIADFPDQKYISDWAVEGTKYMSKLGIIKGDEKGNFMPKATTTAQEAMGYGMATREAAVLMSVRTYETIK